MCFDWTCGTRFVTHSIRDGTCTAQLPVRYAAVYSFFMEGLDAASARLKAFMEKAAQATLVGDVFDDAGDGARVTEFFLTQG